jgi:hypothetical protein
MIKKLVVLFILIVVGLFLVDFFYYKKFVGCIPKGGHGNYFQHDKCCYGLRDGIIGNGPVALDGGFDCIE